MHHELFLLSSAHGRHGIAVKLKAGLVELVSIAVVVVVDGHNDIPSLIVLIPGLMGPQVTSLDFSCLQTILDKIITKTVYTNMENKIERLVMGKSFFFCPSWCRI